jgi:hypothetical protein
MPTQNIIHVIHSSTYTTDTYTTDTGHMSASGKPYYLGIVHHKEWGLDMLLYYPHYLYKMQPHPPFRIMEVAYRRLPLVLETGADAWRRRIAFVSGQWLDGAHRGLYISYGSADNSARVFYMSASMIEPFFLPPEAMTAGAAHAAQAAKKAQKRRKS